MFVVDKTGTQGRLRTFDTFTSAAIAALDAFRLAGNDEPRDNDAPIAMLIRVSPTLQAEKALTAESEPDNPSMHGGSLCRARTASGIVSPAIALSDDR